MARLISILALLLAIGAQAVAQELLEPEKAFQFSARLLDDRQVEIKYVIAPGYYLYREKFKFTAEPASVSVDATQLPPGKVKKDEFFGEVQTYRGELRFVLPVKGLAAQAPQFTLKAVSQGCADIGVCYPPQEQTARCHARRRFGPRARRRPQRRTSRIAPLARAPGPQSEDALIAGLVQRRILGIDRQLLRFRPAASADAVRAADDPDPVGDHRGAGRAPDARARFRAFAGRTCSAWRSPMRRRASPPGCSERCCRRRCRTRGCSARFAAIFVLLALSMFGVLRVAAAAAMQSRLAVPATGCTAGISPACS